MRHVACLRAIAAALTCLAVLTACSGEPGRPTLEEATRQLANDGDALLSMVKTDLTGLTEERANKDRTTSCKPGEIQRYFTAKGNFTNLAGQDPISRIGLLKGKLQALGYREVVDELDVSEDELGVVVTHHAEAHLTFVLVGRASEAPNLVIVGKTECYPRAG